METPIDLIATLAMFFISLGGLVNVVD